MRNRSAWLVAGLGVAAAVATRFWRARRPAAVLTGSEATEAAPDPRAEELRSKLAESRALVSERDEFERGETTVDTADAPTADPGQRRRGVHEHGRAAIEEMRGRAQ